MINYQTNTLSWLGMSTVHTDILMDFPLFREREGKGFKIWKYILPFLFIILFYSPPTFALDVTLQWDANSESNLAGYKLYYDTDSGAPYNGTGAQEGNSPVDVPLARDENVDPNVVEFTLHNLPNGPYYFAVTAYNNEDPPLESGYSNEVERIPVAPSIVPFPVIDYANDTMDVSFSESNMQNTTTETNYTFSPSLLFKTLGGSDDIVYVDNNIYRLSMSSVPNYLIFTLTVSNVMDAADNPLMPNFIRINDNDDDGMADDWEADLGIENPSEDPDLDGMDNLGEYNNGTNPNDSDSDGDSLPDGWEITYGLDPNDSTGINGADGDPDGDTWTNYEEYLNGYRPDSDTSPKAKEPTIKNTIPRDKSGIRNKKRVPIDASFAVRIQDADGIDVTDSTSIIFTIDDSTNPVYERNLGDTDFVRVVKLTEDADTKVQNAWVVYDRSLDPLGNYSFDTDVSIKVDVRDKRGTIMPQESYVFNIETIEEHDLAQETRPEVISTNDSGMTTLTVVNGSEMDGFQLIYDDTEPITPIVEPLNEIPTLDLPYVTALYQPVELGPPNVFNNPVLLRVPVSSEGDVRDLSVYLYDGEVWVYAVSSYNTGGVVQLGGEDWVVPGSLTYDDTGATTYLEVQVYHFSGIQVGVFGGFPFLGIDDTEAGGGCFIETVAGDTPLLSPVKRQSGLRMGIFLSLLCLALSVCGVRRRWRA